ncbi:MAG: rhodanese-like domain-containing protein [Mariprofundaceae bacterium]|nr:rhodanese-like domain-containing protein [Mariprofundaceae bacterium]
MKLTIAASMMMLAAAASACGTGDQSAGYENTDVHHAYQHWQQGEHAAIPFLMLDVRTPEEFAEGHIAGARLIPVQELEKRLAEVPKNRQVYVYCRSGVRSARASEMLFRAGFTHIENITGGIQAWQAAGYPVVR